MTDEPRGGMWFHGRKTHWESQTVKTNDDDEWRWNIKPNQTVVTTTGHLTVVLVIYVIILILTKTVRGRHYYFSLSDEERCLVEPGLGPEWSGPRTRLFTNRLCSGSNGQQGAARPHSAQPAQSSSAGQGNEYGVRMRQDETQVTWLSSGIYKSRDCTQN